MHVPVENRGDEANEVLSEDEKFDGVIVHRLFLKPEAWTHRRVESVEILDSESIHRRVTLDLTIDPELPGIEGLPFTPLTFLKKEVLHNF
ncbi:MAG TPA: hypothetical protein VHR18_05395 [Solirubrobacterales bacterium]|nr:hypothetical protein [Solirubrobacterales bacterium]